MRWLLACTALTIACSSGRAPERPPAEVTSSAENEPIAVHVGGREVRVRCEVSCEPLEGELARLYDGCRADPLRTPHLVGVSGETLAGLGCCTEAEAVYRGACGFDGPQEACGSAWAARCARGGS